MARKTKTSNKQAEFRDDRKIESLSMPDLDFSLEEIEAASLDLSENYLDLENLSNEIALEAEKDIKNKHSISQNKEKLDHSFSDGDLDEGIFFNDDLKDIDQNSFLKPANDDKSGFINPFSKNSFSTKLFQTASIFSAIWFAASLIIIGILWPSQLSFGSFLVSAFGWLSLLGTMLPIIAFWGISYLIKGAKNELRTVAQSLMQSAISSHTKASKEEETRTIAESVRKEVSSMSRAIERTLERGSELEALVHGEVQNLEKAFGENENRIKRLIFELSSEREGILEHADRIHNSLKLTKNKVSEEMSLLTENVAQNINQIAQALNDTLEEKSYAFFSNIQQTSQDVASEFLSRIEATSDFQLDKNKKLLTALNEQLNQVQENFRKGSDNFFKDFQDKISYSEEMVNKIGSQFYENADKFNSDFDKIFNKIDMTIDHQSQKALSVFDEKIKHFDEQTDLVLDSLNDKFSNLDYSLIDRGEKTIELFNSNANQFIEKSLSLAATFEKSSNDTMNIFEKKLNDFDDLLQIKHDAISSTFLENNQNILDNTDKLISVLQERSNVINNNLKEHTEKLENVFSYGSQNFLDAINNVQLSIQAEIDKAELTIAQFFQNQAKTLDFNFDQNQTHLLNLIEEKSLQISGILQNNIGNLSEKLDLIEQSFNNNIDSMDSKIGNFNQISQNLTSSLQNSFSLVQNTLEQYSDNINTRADALKDSLSINSFELNKILSDQTSFLEERIENIRNLLQNGGSEFLNSIEENYKSFQDILSNKNEAFSKNFFEYLENLESQIDGVKLAIEHSSNIKDHLNTRIEGISQSFTQQISLLDQSTNNIQNILDTGIDRARSSLEKSASLLTNSLQNRISEAAQIFSGEAKKAETIVDAIENKLSYTVNSFEEELLNAQKKLSDNTQLLTENIKDSFQNINNSVKDYSKVNPLPDTKNLYRQAPNLRPKANNFSADDITQLSSIVYNFTSYSDILNQAANLLNDVSKNLGNTLSDRETALAMLLNGLIKKKQEISNSFAQFGELIKEKSFYFDNGDTLNLIKNNFLRAQQAESLVQNKIKFSQNFIYQEQKKYSPHSRFISDTEYHLIQEIQNALYAYSHALKNLVSDTESVLYNLNHSFTEKKNFRTARPQNHYPLIQNIQSILPEIVSGIRDNGLADLWNNYHSGRKNIDSSLLYTPQGLSLFERIKYNYDQNQNFKNIVTQYIENFEQSLDNISYQKNTDQQQIKKYLISNDGKIYTMLAHAANRIH